MNKRFPPIELWESYEEGGIEAESYLESRVFAPRDSLVYGCSFRFEKPVKCPPGKDVYLTARVFTYGMKEFHVWFRVLPENVWVQAIRKPRKSRYKFIKVALHDGNEGSNRSISAIRFMGERNSAASKLVVGNIQIATHRTISWKDGEKRPIPIVPEEGHKLFKYWPEWARDYGDFPTIDLKEEEVSQIGAFVDDLLNRYRRYHMKKGVNKHGVVDEHRSLLTRNLPLSKYYRELHNILVLLNDSHFEIRKKRTGGRKLHINDVVKFYRIDGRVVVAAVFDKDLRKVVMVGDEIVSVDDVPIGDYIQGRTRSTYGSTAWIKDRIIIERLLIEDSKKRIKMTFRRPTGRLFSVERASSDGIEKSVPENFLRERLTYRKLGEFAYLRLGIWDERTWPFFYSHIDSLRRSKGLILDLRSNPGGDASTFRLAASFLDKPSLFITTQYRHSLEKVDHFVINPDPFYTYKAPVVILADSRTACGSELFISMMKRHYSGVCTLINQGATSGAVQMTWAVNIAGRHKLIYPYPAYDAFGMDLEGRGIEPDLSVNLNSYRDLAPYGDKLLRVGLECLSQMGDSRTIVGGGRCGH